MRTVEPKQYVRNSLGLTKRVSAAALLLGILLPQPAVSAERLFFASDVHYQLENLASLASSYATSCELACILGDYASSSTTTFSDYKQTYYSMASYVPFTIFTQGNHETFSDGYFNAGLFAQICGREIVRPRVT